MTAFFQTVELLVVSDVAETTALTAISTAVLHWSKDVLLVVALFSVAMFLSSSWTMFSHQSGTGVAGAASVK
jgi:hypothetical protein